MSSCSNWTLATVEFVLERAGKAVFLSGRSERRKTRGMAASGHRSWGRNDKGVQGCVFGNYTVVARERKYS